MGIRGNNNNNNNSNNNLNHNYNLNSNLIHINSRNSIDQDELMEYQDTKFEELIRIGFIRKVYGIIASQLLITIGFVLMSLFNEDFAKYQQNSWGMFILCTLFTCILPCVITCCKSTMSKVPKNYFILMLFTFSESYLVSYICSVTNPKIVFMAAFMTGGIVIAVTIYAYTTNKDFTIENSLYFILGSGLIMLTLFSIFSDNKFIHILMCVFGVSLVGIYIIYDTQLIIGKKEIKLSHEDYILASFMLYVDIVNLFIYSLEFVKLLFKD